MLPLLLSLYLTTQVAANPFATINESPPPVVDYSTVSFTFSPSSPFSPLGFEPVSNFSMTWDYAFSAVPPAGIAVDSASNVYVLDVLQCRVAQYSPTGSFLSQWGSCGSNAGNGVFYPPWPAYTSSSQQPNPAKYAPGAITIDLNNIVYVAISSKSGESLVQKFYTNGTWISQFSGPNSSAISGIAVSADLSYVYLADANNRSVLQYSNSDDGKLLQMWSSPFAGSFPGPYGVTVDASGVVYVADPTQQQIRLLYSNGSFTNFSLGSSSTVIPFGLAIAVGSASNPQTLLVADASCCILRYAMNGTLLQNFTSIKVFVPQGIAVDSAGNIFVMNNGLQNLYLPSEPFPFVNVGSDVNLQKFNSSGTLLFKRGAWFPTLGFYSWSINTSAVSVYLGAEPSGIAVDYAHDAVFLVSFYTFVIQKFSLNGTFLDQFGGFGDPPGQGYFGFLEVDKLSTAPNCSYLTLMIDVKSQTLYTVDAYSNLVTLFNSSTGLYLGQWNGSACSGATFYSPAAGAVDPSGNVYLMSVFTSQSSATVYIFDSSGACLRHWTASCQGTPLQLALDDAQNIYIAVDSGANTNYIDKFSQNGTILSKFFQNGTILSEFTDSVVDFYGVAVDSFGFIYSSPGTTFSTLLKYFPNGTSSSSLQTTSESCYMWPFTNPLLSMDIAGNLWLLSTFNCTVLAGTHTMNPAVLGFFPTGFQCHVDTGSWQSCASPFTYEASPGTHSFSVRTTVNTRVTTVNWTYNSGAIATAPITSSRVLALALISLLVVAMSIFFSK